MTYVYSMITANKRLNIECRDSVTPKNTWLVLERHSQTVK